MKKTVYLHVGFHKTGTTSLQRVLKNNSEELAIQNLDYITDSSDNAHVFAWSLSRRFWGWKNEGGKKTNSKVWDRAVKRIRKSRKNVLLSSEFFTDINLEQIEKLKNDLRDFEVKIIFTWRPLKKLIISSYQQYLKYGIKVDLDDWLHSIFDNPPESKITPTFWKRHMHGQVLENWATVFGSENMTIIVISEDNHDFLFSAFEEALTIKNGTLKSDNNDILNRSLNIEEVELLLEINRTYPRDLGWSAYENTIRTGAIKNLTSTKPKNVMAEKLILPLWVKKSIEKVEEIQNAKILKLNCRLIGNFEDAISSSVEYGEATYPKSISISTASIAIIGAGRQTLNNWRIRQLLHEVMRRLLRKFK